MRKCKTRGKYRVQSRSACNISDTFKNLHNLQEEKGKGVKDLWSTGGGGARLLMVPRRLAPRVILVYLHVLPTTQTHPECTYRVQQQVKRQAGRQGGRTRGWRDSLRKRGEAPGNENLAWRTTLWPRSTLAVIILDTSEHSC